MAMINIKVYKFIFCLYHNKSQLNIKKFATYIIWYSFKKKMYQYNDDEQKSLMEET